MEFLKVNPDTSPRIKSYKETFFSLQDKDPKVAERYLNGALNDLVRLSEDDKALGLDNSMRKWKKEAIEKLHGELLEFSINPVKKAD